jgi:hypothetical protein
VTEVAFRGPARKAGNGALFITLAISAQLPMVRFRPPAPKGRASSTEARRSPMPLAPIRRAHVLHSAPVAPACPDLIAADAGAADIAALLPAAWR